jgi:anti-anti-sigma factor
LNYQDWGSLPAAPEAVVFALDHIRPGARLVRLLGSLDERTSPGMLNLVKKQLSLTEDLLILDLTELTQFASGAVQALVQIAMETTRLDIHLHLVGADDTLGAALDDAGVRDLFELHGSVDEALAVGR